MNLRRLSNTSTWIRRMFSTQRSMPTSLPFGRLVRPPIASRAERKPVWWKDAVIYEIYVPSFMDTNGDGFGDLRGVTERLEYLTDLGINIIWLSPIFDSPMYDMGYDIADYYKINPMYGNMEDFSNLLEQAHKRGLRLILDIALNHTSNEHAWFKKSVAAHKGAANGFKNFYIWSDPIVDNKGNRRPPSNWSSVFEGCMWEWVPEISKYYLHVFGKQQPDLNWGNADVRKELWKVLRFWLDKGVDGFRLDAINCVSKVHNQDLSPARPGEPTVSGWPDALITTPDTFEQKANEMFANGPRVHEYLREMHQEVFNHYDALSLGEMSCGITPEMGPEFISRDPSKQELDLILHFEHVELDCVDGDKWVLREWELTELKASITKWQTRMAESGGWDTVWIENHDQPRGLSRYCNEATTNREHAAKLLAMWLFTLQGSIIIYQGQELGMTNPEEFSEEAIRDIETRIYWNAANGTAPARTGQIHNLDTVKKAITAKTRDASRIPIPWNKDGETSGGFTKAAIEPWLPALPNFREISAKDQRQDPSSVWSFYRDLICLRKEHPALIYGVYQLLDEDHPSIFAYTRTHVDGTYLIVLNFCNTSVEWSMPETGERRWTVVLSTSTYAVKGQMLTAKLELGPFDGIICRPESLDDPQSWEFIPQL